MRVRRAVELSVVPLFNLIQKENLGDPHPILSGGEGYVSPRFAAEWEREWRKDLADAGLGDREALRDFVNTLALVQRAGTEYYAWVGTNDESYALLVVASGRRAASLTRVGDRVTFEWADPDRLVESLVYRLPEVPAARGESISVLADEFAAANSRPRGSVMRRSAAARPDGVRRLAALLKAPRLGVAKLYAAARDPGGNRHRSDEWINVLDLADGRWAVYATRGRGQRAINAVPVTTQLLASKLIELRRTVH